MPSPSHRTKILQFGVSKKNKVGCLSASPHILRPRSDSLDDQTIQNTSIFGLKGEFYFSKIVDINQNNDIQVIFKFNGHYNRWKCRLNISNEQSIDNLLTNIYLKSLINTVQLVKCFRFDEDNYLLIDIVLKDKKETVTSFLTSKSEQLKKNDKSTLKEQVIGVCENALTCISEATTSDVIDYDNCMKIVHSCDSD
jgi:hypothetical protein